MSELEDSEAWREWIKTNGYVGAVGCSFTWGQGLWNYDTNNKNTPTYDEYIFQGIEPTLDSQKVREKLRYPRLLANHFGTDELSKALNGGCDAQSIDILNDVIHSRSQNPEMKGKWPLDKMRLLIFQHSAVVRCNHLFNFNGKKYRIELRSDGSVQDEIWEVKERGDLYHRDKWEKERYEELACGVDDGRRVSSDIFFNYLVSVGMNIDEFWLHHCRRWLRRVQDTLRKFDDLGIPIVCWHWDIDLINVIHEEEFEWIRSITAPIIVNDKSYSHYMEAAIPNHRDLFIRYDKEANRYGEDKDEHPSKWGMEVITSSILKNLQDRDITIYL